MSRLPQDESVTQLGQELAQKLGLRVRKAYKRPQVGGSGPGGRGSSVKTREGEGPGPAGSWELGAGKAGEMAQCEDSR